MDKEAGTPLGDEWEVVVARTLEEIDAIRPIWEHMQHNELYPTPNADIDIYLSFVEASGDDVQPYVILAKQEGHPRAMVIGRRERFSVALRLGYKTLWSPKLECLTIVYGGVLGRPKSEVCSLLLAEMLSVLHSRQVDMVFFNRLRVDSDAYKVITATLGFWCLGFLPPAERHWAISVPETMDELYQRYSPRNRSNLHRLINKLEKAYPDRVRVRVYTEQHEVDAAIEAMAHISDQTYQSRLKAGFVDVGYTRDMLQLAARRGWLRACVLFIGDEPSAFQLALRYGRSYFGLHTGFDPKWRQFRVGTVLFLKFLESICGDTVVKSFDFGFGDAGYKRLYSDQHWEEATVRIFANRPYPLLINTLRSSTTVLNTGLEYVVSRIGAADWIKRRWRHALEESNRN